MHRRGWRLTKTAESLLLRQAAGSVVMRDDHRRWYSDEKAFLLGFVLGSLAVMIINLLTIVMA